MFNVLGSHKSIRLRCFTSEFLNRLNTEMTVWLRTMSQDREGGKKETHPNYFCSASTTLTPNLIKIEAAHTPHMLETEPTCVRPRENLRSPPPSVNPNKFQWVDFSEQKQNRTRTR